MKISLSQGDLNSALQVVQKAVSSRGILPILTGILFKVEEEYINLYSTDLEISIKHKLPVSVDSAGSAVLPAKLIVDIVKNLPDARIDLVNSERGDSVRIACSSSVFDVKAFSPEDFPGFPEIKKEQSISINGKNFSEMVRQVIKAVSKDETRPVLSGALVTIEKDRIKMVATDSYRLSIREMTIENSTTENIKVIVPARCLDEASKICGDNNMEIGLAKNQIYFNIGEVIIVSRLIEGQFPNYQQLLPSDSELRVKFNRASLISSLKRVSLLAQSNALVKMKMGDGAVEVSAITQDVGSAVERIEAEINGDGMEIAFNAQFLIDGLNSIDEEEVFLELNNPLKPGLLRPAVNQDFIYLVMPVRIG